MPEASDIIIVSRNKALAEEIIEQVRRELALPCQWAESATTAPATKNSLWITNEEVPDSQVSLTLGPLPLRLHMLLEDISAWRYKKTGDDLALEQGYSLQPRQKQLAYATLTVPLTDKEVQLLECLHRAAGSVVSKEELLRQIWGIDAPLETHTLETHIYRLRGKLRELGGNEDAITAEAGGYRWNG